ncbi:alpha/beta hydrolase family protein [Falsiroseomonas sp.]|uniref:alpha/beta hydrolase family protein n=1 Tax=Falsiroseomonas sp. TaxID=2870721 RepID=UPI003F716463
MPAFRLIALLLLLAIPSLAGAETPGFRAGVARPSATGEAPFEMLVWYPTEAEEVPWQTGPFPMPATREAAVAPGRFPVLLLSHGGGRGGGTPLILREISVALARRGYVVIAPFHGRPGLAGRPQQMRRALETVRADPRFAAHLDTARLGMLGFSLGTAVTLQLAGAVPNPAHLLAYCAAHPRDAMSCGQAPEGNNAAPAQAPMPAEPLPLKALVLMDPFAVLFQRPELAGVTIPVLILRPEASELPGEANATGLAAGLPQTPQVQAIPGGHFVFTDICPTVLRAASPELCEDPPGVDRAAVHAAVEARIIAFLRERL